MQVDRTGVAARLRTFIQSDRGIYRPGETAHFKGLVREVSAGRPPRLPRSHQVAVQLIDSKETTIWQQTRSLSAFGGFSLDLPIAPEAPTGDYTLVAQIGPLELVDRNGQLLRRVPAGGHQPGRRAWVPLSEILSAAYAVVVASEDRQFYRHSGVDARSCSRCASSGS